MPSQTTLTLLHKEAKNRVFLQGTVFLISKKFLENLVCFLFQDTYQELVKYLIESQTDPGNRQRLMEAFRKLTLELPMSAERLYRIRFRENFEKFVVEVRGFLLIK